MGTEHPYNPWNETTFLYAAKNGNLAVIQWLRANKCPWDHRTFEFAAKNGNLENMKWLKANHCPWNSTTFSEATRSGILENMKWLHKAGCPINIHVIHRENCDAEALDWLDNLQTGSKGSRMIKLFRKFVSFFENPR